MVIENSQRIEVDVEPLIRDSQHLEMTVYNDRGSSAQGLQINILPLVESSQRILVVVRNQAYETAAAERLIAPGADITFE